VVRAPEEPPCLDSSLLLVIVGREPSIPHGFRAAAVESLPCAHVVPLTLYLVIWQLVCCGLCYRHWPLGGQFGLEASQPPLSANGRCCCYLWCCCY